jgi:hypothetical protein
MAWHHCKLSLNLPPIFTSNFWRIYLRKIVTQQSKILKKILKSLNNLKSLAFKCTLASRERCSSTSSILSSFDWIKVIGGTLLMDTNLGDALSGLLLLSRDSNNDSDDGSTTRITNDSNVTQGNCNSQWQQDTAAHCRLQRGRVKL